MGHNRVKPARLAGAVLAAAIALVSCREAVPYAVSRDEIGLIPYDSAARFLQQLPGSGAVAARSDRPLCDFTDSGLRRPSPPPVGRARESEVVRYDRSAFVITRTMGGAVDIDVDYLVPNTTRTEGCGMRLDARAPDAVVTVRRIATALSALGSQGQSGLIAQPQFGAR